MEKSPRKSLSLRVLVMLNVGIVCMATGAATLIPIALAQAYQGTRLIPSALQRFFNESATASTPYLSQTLREILAEQNSIPTRFDERLGYRHAPFSGRHTNVDKNGERRMAGAEAVGTTDHTLWFLGASQLWGYGLAEGTTLPEQVSQSLGIPARNLSRPGFTAREALAKLIMSYADLEGERTPKIIIHSAWEIDFIFACQYSEETFETAWGETQARRSPHNALDPYQVVAPLKALLGAIQRNISGNQRSPSTDGITRQCRKPLLKKAQQATQAYLKAAQAIATANGDRFILLAPPLPKTSEPSEKAFANGLSRFPFYKEVTVSSAATINDVINTSNMQAINAIELFSSKENQCFFDGMHLTDKCNDEFARFVIKNLEEITNE